MIYTKDGKILMDAGKLRGCCCEVCEDPLSATVNAFSSVTGLLSLDCEYGSGCIWCPVSNATPRYLKVTISNTVLDPDVCCGWQTIPGYVSEKLPFLSNPDGEYILEQRGEDSCVWEYNEDGSFGLQYWWEGTDTCSGEKTSETNMVLKRIMVSRYENHLYIDGVYKSEAGTNFEFLSKTIQEANISECVECSGTGSLTQCDPDCVVATSCDYTIEEL